MWFLKILLVKSRASSQPFFTQIAKIECILGINCCLCSLLPVIAPLPDDDVVDGMKRSERGTLTTKTMTRSKAKTSLLPVIAPLPDDDVVDCMKRSKRGALTTKTIAARSAAAALLQAGAEDSVHSSIGS